MSNNEIVPYYSDEAATYKTGIKGWISRTGIYYGDGPDSEHIARYAGCTHRACNVCGELVDKGWLTCKACRDAADRKRYEAMPPVEWDGKAMIYAEATERFYASPDDARDDMEEGQTIEDLRLIVCVPVLAAPLDADYWVDYLPDDGDIPGELEDAIEVFNKLIDGVVLSWVPGKHRLAV